MKTEIRPRNLPSNFKFKLNELSVVTLKDWPIESIKISTNWNEAVTEFEKYIPYMNNNVVFYSPYPVTAMSIGAAELRNTIIYVRLFLFPMLNPKYQRQAIGQIIFSFGIDTLPEDVEVHLDFLNQDEMEEEQILELDRAFKMSKLKQLLNDYPDRFRLIVNESDVDTINFNADISEPKVFNIYDSEMAKYIESELNLGKQVSMQNMNNDAMMILSAVNLFKE